MSGVCVCQVCVCQVCEYARCVCQVCVYARCVCIPGESYHRQLRPLSLCLYDVFGGRGGEGKGESGWMAYSGVGGGGWEGGGGGKDVHEDQSEKQ